MYVQYLRLLITRRGVELLFYFCSSLHRTCGPHIPNLGSPISQLSRGPQQNTSGTIIYAHTNIHTCTYILYTVSFVCVLLLPTITILHSQRQFAVPDEETTSMTV